MTSGNIADLKLNPSNQKWEAVFKHKVLASSPDQEYVKRVITGGFSKKAKAMGVTDVRVITLTGEVQSAEGETISLTPIRTVEQEFHINERFKIMEDYTEMVAAGELASALVTGEGGLGKTYTVMKSLKKMGVRNITQMEIGARHAGDRGFVVVKGYSTPKGLYRTLYENRNQIIVFDDCDSVLRDPTAVNLLKAALDSYDERIVSWNAEAGGFGENDLPKSFEFTGGVIFISNMSKNKIPQAIRSRAMCADVSMTRTEVVTRMRDIVKSDEFLPEFEMGHKLEALEFVAEHAHDPMITELNLRSLVNVVKARVAKPDHWKRLGLYSMANS